MKRKWTALLTVAALLLILLAACAPKEAETVYSPDHTTVVLRAVNLGNPPTAGLESFYHRLDQLTIPELNCILRFDYIPWGNEKTQLNIATYSGEYDFIPGGVFSDYRILAQKNAFINLYDYEEAAPTLFAHYRSHDQNALAYCEIGGGLYGLPGFSGSGLLDISEGFFYREDLRREWGLEPVTSLETMEAYLYRAKRDARYRDQPLITDNRIWQSLWYMLSHGRYLEISSIMTSPFVVTTADDPYTAVSRMETPEFREILSIIRRWYRDGIIESDLLAFSDNEGTRALNMLLSDEKPCETNAPIWSCNNNYIPRLTQAHPDWEWGFFNYSHANERFYRASMARGSVTSISSKSAHPELAIQLLEKLHTDQRYYDLLIYGVLGEDYHLTDGRVSFDGIDAQNRYMGWKGGNTDETLTREEAPVNLRWYETVYKPDAETIQRLGADAPVFPLDGFTVSYAEVADAHNRITEVYAKHFHPLVCGVTESPLNDLGSALAALYEAGFQTYLDNITAQLQAFR